MRNVCLRQLFTIILSLPYALMAQVTPPPPDTASPDVKDSVTYDLGDHLLTVQKVTEVTIPILPYQPKVEEPPAQAAVALTEAEKAESRHFHILSFGGTVYHPATGPNRSLIHCYGGGENLPVVFWSSMDWNLLSGGVFTTPGGDTYSLMLMLESVDIQKTKEDYAADGERYIAPDIPSFPAGAATYRIVSGNFSPQLLAELNDLHASYDRDFDSLLAAWQKREEQRKLDEAAEKLPKTPPADIITQYREMTPEELKKP